VRLFLRQLMRALCVNKNISMTYETFNDFCRSLSATSYIIQWGDSHVWKVGGKVFAIGGWENADKPAFTFKTTESDFLFLSDESGYRPAPYLASRGMKWIQQFDAPDTEDDELRYYLKESHRIVSLGLTKKKQKELGLNQN
jgi:predicted DNA-binding protein (MmcQ/YjbR family)